MERVDISYQIGSRFDGSQDLLWLLRRNGKTLTDAGVTVPRPRSYRRKIADFAQSANDHEVPGSAQEELLHPTFAKTESGRVFFNDVNLMEPQPYLWDGIRWFPDIGARAAQVRKLFPDANMRFFVGLRCPSSLLSSVLSTGDYAAFGDDLAAPDPFLLSWYDVIEDLRVHVPDVPVTAWCHEELPFVLDRVMHTAAGLPESVQLEGYLDPLEGVMTQEGLNRLRNYLAGRTDLPAKTRGGIVSVFADKFTLDENMDIELEIPGWNQQRQHLIEQSYAKDIGAVATLEGVDLIAA